VCTRTGKEKIVPRFKALYKNVSDDTVKDPHSVSGRHSKRIPEEYKFKPFTKLFSFLTFKASPRLQQ
jgi:hypothetical protein